MDRRTLLGVLGATFVVSLAPRIHAATGPRIVVVVNPKNPIRSLGAGDIEAIFTTRRLDWPGGKRVVPFNFPALHPTRTAFDREALHLEPDEVARFWIDRRVRGGHPPPRQVPDTTTMLRVVAALEAAIGYVDKDHVDSTVRVVAEV